MKNYNPTLQQKKFHRDFATLMKKHLAKEPPEVLLAIAAHAVGQLIALQDKRTMTGEKAMQIVLENIHAGNQHMISSALLNPGGSA